MKYIIHKSEDPDVPGRDNFRTFPEDRGMAVWDFNTLEEAMAEVAGSMRPGDIVGLTQGTFVETLDEVPGERTVQPWIVQDES